MPPIPKKPRERQKTFFKEWREFRDLKQYEVADKLEIEPSTLSRLERGASPYDQDFLERLALVLGCDPEDLLSINPLQPSPPRLIYSRLMKASPEVQKKALEILDILLKDGTNG